MKIHHMVFFVILTLATLLPVTGSSATVTLESDDFIRCLIGDCHDTDLYYSDVEDPYDGLISGTDLGTFAKGDSLTYIFFGDTYPSPDGLHDAYLAVPNDELEEFITTPEGAVTPEMSARFLTYLLDRYEGFEPWDEPWVGCERDCVDFEYLIGASVGSGFNVPTGAFFNFNRANPLYYVWYGVEVDFQPPSNEDKSHLFRSTFDGLPDEFPWEYVIFDETSWNTVFSQGPGIDPYLPPYVKWNRPPRDPQFRLGKFINIAPVVINTDPENTILSRLTLASACTLWSSERAVLLFGTGKYRDSAVYLAWAPLDSVEEKGSYKYFAFPVAAGRDCWSDLEEDAVPVALTATDEIQPHAGENIRGAGEISVAYVHDLGIFLMAYSGKDLGYPPDEFRPLINMYYSPDGIPWIWQSLDIWGGGADVFHARTYYTPSGGATLQNAYGPYFVPGLHDLSGNTLDMYHVACPSRGPDIESPYSVESRKLTLNIVDRQPVDMVFLQDRTGSMRRWIAGTETSRWEAARNALDMMLSGKRSDSVFESGADTALVYFNYDHGDGTSPSWFVSYGLDANPDPVVWERMIQGVIDIADTTNAALGCDTPWGAFCTSIGNGMNAALDEFRDTGRGRAVVLLTDGEDNAADAPTYDRLYEDVLSVHRFALGTSYYAVALGPETNDDYLNTIAGFGSGFYKTLYFDKLPQIYQAIEADALGYNAVRTEIDQENAHTFIVAPDDYMLKLTLTANVTDEPLGRRLLAVSSEGMYGERLFLSEEQDGVSIVESDSVFVMNISHPRPGRWQVFETEDGTAVPATPPSDKSRAFLVTTASGISIDADLVNRKYYEGETARIKIAVERNGRPACTVGAPDHVAPCQVVIVPHVTFIDRGLEPEEHILDASGFPVVPVGPGQYELQFPVEISGTYDVKLDVSFERSGLVVERSKRLSFFVPPLISDLDIDDGISGLTSLTVDQVQLTAGSQEGALLTLDLRNFLGNGLPGRDVFFTTSLGAFAGEAVDHGGGTYTQVLLPGIQAGLAEIGAVARDRIESTGMPPAPDDGAAAMVAEDPVPGAPETMATKINRSLQVEIRPAAVDPASCDLGLASSLDFLYRDGSDRVRLTLRDAFGNVVTEPADVVFHLLEANGSILEGDVESSTVGVYEQAIRGSSRYVTTVIGASVNGMPVDQVVSLPVFDSPPWSSDCNGDGFPDEGQGLVCRSMDEWWAPLGTYQCDFDSGQTECDAPGAGLVDTAYYWRPGIRAFDVGPDGYVYAVRGALLEVLQAGSGRTGIDMVGRISLGSPGFDVVATGSHVFVGARRGIFVIDVSDPASPWIANVMESPFPIVDVEMDGKNLYAADGYGLAIYDLAEVESPAEVANLDVIECDWDVLCRASALIPLPHPLSVDRGYAVLGDGQRVHIIDVSRSYAPVHVGVYDSDGRIDGLKLERRFVYLADSSQDIIDIRIPEEPIAIGNHDVQDWVMGMVYAGEWAFRTDLSFLRAAKIEVF
jgi:hypothetical protein